MTASACNIVMVTIIIITFRILIKITGWMAKKLRMSWKSFFLLLLRSSCNIKWSTCSVKGICLWISSRKLIELYTIRLVRFTPHTWFTRIKNKVSLVSKPLWVRVAQNFWIHWLESRFLYWKRFEPALKFSIFVFFWVLLRLVYEI